MIREAISSTNVGEDKVSDNTLREEIQHEYLTLKEKEDEYWTSVRLIANEIATNDITLDDCNYTLSHYKKTKEEIDVDIQTIADKRSESLLSGNNGAIMVCKYQPFTKSHIKMINEIKQTHDYIILVVLQDTKSDKHRNKFPLKLKEDMIRQHFSDIDVVVSSTANILAILKLVKKNINTVFTKKGKINNYQAKLKRSFIDVKEFNDDSDEARLAIRNKDYESFVKLVDETLWSYWDTLRVYIK